MASYEKRESGLWSVRFQYVSPESGESRSKRLSGFKTKKEAQYGYEDFISELKRLADEAARTVKIKKQPADMLFGELVEKFFAFEKTRIKESSYYDLTSKVNGKILPYFEKTPLKDISPASILEWQETLSKYAYAYKKDIHAHLVSIYNFGEKYFDIPNVMRKVDRPRDLEGKKEMEIWTPNELHSVLDKVDKPIYRLLYLFLYISGCRRGEAAALTWQDFNLEEKTVTINKNVAYKVGENGKPYRISTPKNKGSNRKLPLPDFFVKELKALKDAISNPISGTVTTDGTTTAAQTVIPQKNTDFVFSANCGEDPLPPTSIERNLTTAATAAGVKRIRVHDLRHSCASFLIHQGINVVTISHHLGHASTKMTLDTYSHLFPSDDEIIKTNLETLAPKAPRS